MNLQRLSADRLRHHLARLAMFYIVANGELKWVKPPMDIVRDVLADPSPRLPRLARVVEAPAFAQDGSLKRGPGYNQSNGNYYAPLPGFEVPPVPESPTAVRWRKFGLCYSTRCLGTSRSRVPPRGHMPSF